MPKSFWTYAGRMGFSLACSILGALLVSKLGLLQVRTQAPLEKIVFDQSDLTRFDDIPQRVEAGHIAMRELIAAQDAQARRQAAAERPAQLSAHPLPQPLPHPRPAAQAEKRKTTAPRREPAFAAAPPAPPLVIAPALAEEPAAPEPNAVERAFDKLASGMARLREAVASAVRIETPRLPFGTAPAPVQVMDGLRERLRLPAIGL